MSNLTSKTDSNTITKSNYDASVIDHSTHTTNNCITNNYVLNKEILQNNLQDNPFKLNSMNYELLCGIWSRFCETYGGCLSKKHYISIV